MTQEQPQPLPGCTCHWLAIPPEDRCLLHKQPLPADVVEKIREAIKHGLACAEIFLIKHCNQINAGTVLTAVKEAQAALSALPQRPVDGWQPIETAPKDGTRILVVTSEYIELLIADWRPDSEGGGGWASDEVIGFVYATHWMPLPPAPSSKQGVGDE